MTRVSCTPYRLYISLLINSRPNRRFQSFVHLSTAFCHCEYETLDETVYPSPANPDDVMRAVEWMDDYTLEMITPRLLCGE